MINLHFNDPSEFENLFGNKNLEITNATVKGIADAMRRNKKSAHLFNVTFSDHEFEYEIIMSSLNWPDALESCLDFYHKNEMSDEAIDTWKLLECAKVW